LLSLSVSWSYSRSGSLLRHPIPIDLSFQFVITSLPGTLLEFSRDDLFLASGYLIYPLFVSFLNFPYALDALTASHQLRRALWSSRHRPPDSSSGSVRCHFLALIFPPPTVHNESREQRILASPSRSLWSFVVCWTREFSPCMFFFSLFRVPSDSSLSLC